MKKNENNKKIKVAVGLSGGVDSAVSAYLLKKQGFDIVGVYLDCYRGTNFPCQADIDRAMAVKIAHFLHIPMKIIDLRSQYSESVISYFFEEYRNGRTPNPDVICNRDIKFGIFYDMVINEWKFDFVATGHYARIINQKKNKVVEKFLGSGIDVSKDQSYFLYLLKKEQLEHIMFPVGELTKKEVRAVAKKAKLPNFAKPDSQGICFIGEVNVKKFLLTQIKQSKGDVLDLKGNKIGEHEGAWFYTIGQRHGFKIDNRMLKKTNNNVETNDTEPLYIVSKDVTHNMLKVATREHLYKWKFMVSDRHLLVDENKWEEVIKKELKVRVRHLGELVDCTIVQMANDKTSKNNGVSGALYEVVLKKPIFALAPGQSAVFYDGDVVVGGGIIYSDPLSE